MEFLECSAVGKVRKKARARAGSEEGGDQEARVFLIISLVAGESAKFANESLSGVLIWESRVTRRMTYQRGSFISGGIDKVRYARRGQAGGSRQWEDFFAASQLYSVWNPASFGARPDRSMPRWHSLFGMAQGSRSRQIPGTDSSCFSLSSPF